MCLFAESDRHCEIAYSLSLYLSQLPFMLFVVSHNQEVKACLQTQFSPLWCTKHTTNEFNPNFISMCSSQIIWTQCDELKISWLPSIFAGRTGVFTNHKSHSVLWRKMSIHVNNQFVFYFQWDWTAAWWIISKFIKLINLW